ncbi:MAG: zinc ribbon domain-containing protein [Bacteroidetes bacterium]|nr:zinc ribbon domain-containing protein [Bacteroidota bacterium]
MICSSCGNDNPRSALECVSCGTRMNVVRCRCGFLNSLMDAYCGSCGKQLMKTSVLSRLQRFESSANPFPNFSEEELMRIIEVQQMHIQAEQHQNAVSQTDIDKLFE